MAEWKEGNVDMHEFLLGKNRKTGAHNKYKNPQDMPFVEGFIMMQEAAKGPETDLRKVSHTLGIPESRLLPYLCIRQIQCLYVCMCTCECIHVKTMFDGKILAFLCFCVVSIDGCLKFSWAGNVCQATLFECVESSIQ